MDETHDKWCPICEKRVNARLIDSNWRYRKYECPNVDLNGRPHNFSKSTFAWSVMTVAATAVSSYMAGRQVGKIADRLDERNRNRKDNYL